MKYLVDSNIIIYHLNGIDRATYFLAENINNIAISFITYIEVLSYPMNEMENQKVRELLELFMILHSDHLISEKAVEIRKNRKIKVPDCIIAATALVKDLKLVTRNTVDFMNLIPDIINPIDS